MKQVIEVLRYLNIEIKLNQDTVRVFSFAQGSYVDKHRGLVAISHRHAEVFKSS